MNRTEKEEYIIGFISLISNKIVQFGDLMLTDITFPPQWFLLMMISKMEQQEKKHQQHCRVCWVKQAECEKDAEPPGGQGLCAY